MKYPAIPRDLRRNVVNTAGLIEKMKQLRKEGFSIRKIAKELNSNYTSVQRYLQSPEKRQEELKRNREYHKAWMRSHPIPKAKRAANQRETRKHRKVVLGSKERTYKSFANTKQRHKNDKEHMLQTYIWHKKQISNLLDIEPLLVLFR